MQHFTCFHHVRPRSCGHRLCWTDPGETPKDEARTLKCHQAHANTSSVTVRPIVVVGACSRSCRADCLGTLLPYLCQADLAQRCTHIVCRNTCDTAISGDICCIGRGTRSSC